MKKLLLLLAFLPSVALGTPSVSTVTGTIQDGQSITIGGTVFGSKSPAAPYLWAPFDSSSNPSSLGQKTTWNTINNMSWTSSEGYNSGGGMKGSVGVGNWTMDLRNPPDAWNKAGTNTYVFSREKLNFIVQGTGQNFKIRRFWPSSGNVSNLYMSSSHGRIFVENIGGAVDSGFFKNCNVNTTNWVTRELFLQPSSAPNVKDGVATERFDGVQKYTGNLITRSAAAPQDWTQGVVVHGVLANAGSWVPAWDSSNNMWADDVYVDRTYSRAMICDQPVFANCRKFGMVIPTAWSATSITGQLAFHSNDFPAQTTAYAYVFDSSNVSNTAGKSIVIGGSVVGNPAPTLTGVNPSTATYSVPTVATATGTGFLTGIVVNVGTMSATSVTLVNSTTVRFTFPYGPSSTSGLDLQAVNTDGQSAVITSTISYTTPVANQAPFNVSAGDDWEITLPATTLLAGSASDDGLPTPPATLTYLWQQKSGPGTVTFGDSTALQTSAVFSSSGTYTLSLTANDSLLSTESAVVSVVVHPVITTTGGSSSGAGTGSPGGTAYGFTKQP